MTEHHEPLSDSEPGSGGSGRDTRFQAKVSPEMHEQIVRRARAGESNAQIGRDLGVSGQRVGQIVRAHGGLHATGPTSLDADARSRSLANLKDAPPAPRGNLRHLKHGLRSERTMQPYRARAIEWAEQRWPWLDPTRRELVADLAARVARVNDWSDEGDVVKEVQSGPGSKVKVWSVHPVVDSADRWQQRLWDRMRELDAEAAEREREADTPSLADVIAEIEANRETEQ